MEEITFTPGSVPVVVVARVYGKDASWVRAGIISGWLPIGKATRNMTIIFSMQDLWVIQMSNYTIFRKRLSVEVQTVSLEKPTMFLIRMYMILHLLGTKKA